MSVSSAALTRVIGLIVMDGSGSKPLDPKLPDSKSRDSKPLFAIRSFRAGDLASCTALYREGLLGGKIAENDTGLDIDDIERAYMTSPGSHFWVAEAQNEVVGMIGVQHHDDDVGEIRRLRVRQDWRRRGIGSALIETALKFCQEKGYLKIALDTFVEREPAIKLFEKFHFRHHRTRTIGDKQILHFYLDLYQRDDRSRQKSDIGTRP